MNAEEMYEVWTPADSVWSAWVKPVLFAHMGAGRADMGRLSAEEMASALAAVPLADGATAVVIDLPGATGVMAGMELARRGYRPVPLYNAVPGPTAWTVGADVVCDLGPIVWAIREATPVLAGMGDCGGMRRRCFCWMRTGRWGWGGGRGRGCLITGRSACRRIFRRRICCCRAGFDGW